MHRLEHEHISFLLSFFIIPFGYLYSPDYILVGVLDCDHYLCVLSFCSLYLIHQMILGYDFSLRAFL